jgi:hypothetical protein
MRTARSRRWGRWVGGGDLRRTRPPAAWLGRARPTPSKPAISIAPAMCSDSVGTRACTCWNAPAPRAREPGHPRLGPKGDAIDGFEAHTPRRVEELRPARAEDAAERGGVGGGHAVADSVAVEVLLDGPEVALALARLAESVGIQSVMSSSTFSSSFFAVFAADSAVRGPSATKPPPRAGAARWSPRRAGAGCCWCGSRCALVGAIGVVGAVGAIRAVGLVGLAVGLAREQVPRGRPTPPRAPGLGQLAELEPGEKRWAGARPHRRCPTPRPRSPCGGPPGKPRGRGRGGGSQDQRRYSPGGG